jgi:hypothetical protein
MANSFFDWASSLQRFVRFDAARAEEVNTALDEVSAGFDDVEVKTNAAIKGPDGENNAAIPAKASRLNKVLTFDASGDPVTTYTIADVATVSGIAANVTTVAGIAGNVTTVATNDANVTTVAGSIANVNAVGTNIANVIAVDGNVLNINAAVANEANINAVAADAVDIGTVAAADAAIGTVATNIASVNTAATNIAAIIAAPTEASNAASSANSAASLYDSFDDRYLGAKSSSPTTDNDGNTLLVGALYWDSVNKKMYTWDGANWDEWGSGAGATGGAGNAAFYENDTTITADYTITTGKNAMSAGPITVNSGVTVTIPSGSCWTIVGS